MGINEFRAGWSTIDITPDRPIFLAGQLYPRVSQYVQDPITATAFAFSSGPEQGLMLSADMVSVPGPVLARLKDSLAGLDGLRPESISFSVTHTHNSSTFGKESYWQRTSDLFGADLMPEFAVPPDILTGQEAEDFLYERIFQLARSAWLGRKKAGLSSAHEYAAIGFNRRPVFEKDGGEESIMYGDASRPDFIRFEGTVDHAADLLYVWDEKGSLTGLVVIIPCPSQVYELHQMVTADYWASTRRQLKERFGPIFILPLCGAAGDQNPLDLVTFSKDNQKTLPIWAGQTREVERNFDLSAWCDKIGARITGAASLGYEDACSRINYFPPVKHLVRQISLPLRQVSAADNEAALARIAEVKAAGQRLSIAELVRLFETLGIIKRYQEQQESSSYSFTSHILRLGQLALATNPFELFCEFGLRLKAQSPARQTAVVQLTDGSGGYLPTHAALAGGSYSSKPASTACGPESGDRYVEISLAALTELF